MLYLDSSAIVKLIRPSEAWSTELRAYLKERELPLVVSALARAELLRTAHGNLEEIAEARTILGAMSLIAITNSILDCAGILGPKGLRSLDAIHVATVQALGNVDALITYDDRMLEAAKISAIPTLAPGRS